MSYSTRPIWIPTDKQQENIVAAAGAITPVQASGSDIPRGLVYGYHWRVNLVDAGNAAVSLILYDSVSGAFPGDAIYSTTFDAAAAVQGVDTLDTPIPCFETPYFQVSAVAVARTFTIRFLFKAMA